jgi:hypothetical protein
MSNTWAAINIGVTTIPIVAVLISAIYLTRATQKHIFVVLAWCVSLITGVAALVIQVFWDD